MDKIIRLLVLAGLVASGTIKARPQGSIADYREKNDRNNGSYEGNFLDYNDDAYDEDTGRLRDGASRHKGHGQAGHHHRKNSPRPEVTDDDSNRTKRKRWFVESENRSHRTNKREGDE